jgi:serine/threonine-protein kinase
VIPSGCGTRPELGQEEWMQATSRTLGGRYELRSLLATGGMGRVWEARDTLLQRDVAVKVLRSEYADDAAFLARFRAEAKHTADLTHPNIAALYDYGEVMNDEPGGERLAYLVMELVRGEALSDALAREGRLSADRTLAFLRQAAAGLAAAHARGVVHRDVKPGNFLLGANGTVKITDFGIAHSPTSMPLTLTGQVVGTANYLSPEQAQGAKAGPASDVYALGLVAYECLSGHRAFEGENSVQIALKQIRENPQPLPDDVPVEVRPLVDRALAKDPAERYPGGEAFRAAVDDVIARRPVGAPAPVRATAVMPAVLPGSAREGASPGTRVMPAAAPEGRRTARRMLVPILVLSALVAVAWGLLQVRASGGGSAAGTTAPSATSSAPATSAAPIQVRAGDYVGRPAADVQAALTALGLQVQLRPIQTADVPDQQVIAVDPVGDLDAGQQVVVTHAVAPPAPAAGADEGKGGGHGHGHGRGRGGKNDD